MCLNYSFPTTLTLRKEEICYLLRLSKSPAAAAYIKLTIVSPLLSYRTLLGLSLLTNLVELSYLKRHVDKWVVKLVKNDNIIFEIVTPVTIFMNYNIPVEIENLDQLFAEC